MYSCVYISLTKYAIEGVHLLFRISDLSQVTDATFFSFIPAASQCWDRVDAERLLNSSGKHGVGCSTAAKLNGHWINAGLCPAHRTLGISGGLWGSGPASAGPDARLLHDDWMICLRQRPFLIDSEMSESAILKYKHQPKQFSSFSFRCFELIRRLYGSSERLCLC